MFSWGQCNSCLVFNLYFQIAFINVSHLITETILFLQFVKFSSSFVGTPKNEIPGAALELYQLKIKQFSPEIPKFSTKHEDNPFTLNCHMVPRIFCLYFMKARVDWVLIIFETQVLKKKRPVRPVFADYLSVFYDYDSTGTKFEQSCLMI